MDRPKEFRSSSMQVIKVNRNNDRNTIYATNPENLVKDL